MPAGSLLRGRNGGPARGPRAPHRALPRMCCTPSRVVATHAYISPQKILYPRRAHALRKVSHSSALRSERLLTVSRSYIYPLAAPPLFFILFIIIISLFLSLSLSFGYTSEEAHIFTLFLFFFSPILCESSRTCMMRASARAFASRSETNERHPSASPVRQSVCNFLRLEASG